MAAMTAQPAQAPENTALAAELLDLEKFAATPLLREPFDFLIVPGFVKASARNAVSRDFPAIANPGSFPHATLSYGPVFRQLVEEMQGPRFRAAVEAKFGLDLSGRPTVLTVRGMTDARDGSIHTDSKTKIITVLVYFNEGWEDKGGRLRLLRSGTDLEDYVAEVEPGYGTLLIFRRSDNSWHGHKPYVGQRRTIQMNWVVDEAVKQREEARHGFSAKLKTLFGLGR